MKLQLKERAQGAESEVRMTFGEHLEELRWRLVKSIALLLIVIFLAMVFYKDLVIFMSEPYFVAMKMLGYTRAQVPFLAGTFTGPIIAVMKLVFIVAIFLTSPWIGYQMWAFISAGLYKHERKYVIIFAPVSFILFTLGCIFGYLVLVPICLYGLSDFIKLGDIVNPTYTITEYLSLVMKLTVVLGGVFQVPLIMVFFAKIGVVHPSSYGKWRRAALIANCVFAAILTPADPWSMLLVAVPLALLYEVGVVVSYILVRGKKKEGGTSAPAAAS